MVASLHEFAGATWLTWEEFINKLAGDWYMALRRQAKRALASCVDQSYDDMKAFLLA